jgi:hypothetical protein
MTFEITCRSPLLSRREAFNQKSSVVIADKRVEVDRHLELVDNDIIQTLERSLYGTSVLQEESTKREVVGAILEISQKWASIKNSAVRIGHLLLRIKRASEPAYDIVLRTPGVLPFERSVAVKLRRIAEAIDCGTVEESRLPSAYSAAYEIVTMSSEAIILADREGLIRPETKRQDVLKFKERLRTLQTPAVSGDLAKQQHRLLVRKRKLEQELAELQRQLVWLDERVREREKAQVMPEEK